MNTVEEIKKISLIDIGGNVEFVEIDGERCMTQSEVQKLLSNRIADLIAQAKLEVVEEIEKLGIILVTNK